MEKHGGTGDAPAGVQVGLELQIGAFQNDGVVEAAEVGHAIENDRACVLNDILSKLMVGFKDGSILVKLYEASEALVSPQMHVNEALPPLNRESVMVSH